METPIYFYISMLWKHCCESLITLAGEFHASSTVLAGNIGWPLLGDLLQGLARPVTSNGRLVSLLRKRS